MKTNIKTQKQNCKFLFCRSFFVPLFFVFLIVGASSCGSQKTMEPEVSVPVVPQKEYSRESPREWAGMEDQLVPQITFNKGFGRDIIIRVNLQNVGGDNYIEKIGIMDKNGNEIVSKVFSPNQKFFEAHFFSSDLPANKKDLKVFSKSSLYDLWTTPLPNQF